MKVKFGDWYCIDVQYWCDDGQIIDVELQFSVVEIVGQFYVFVLFCDVIEQCWLMCEQMVMFNFDLVGMMRVVNRIIVWCNCVVECMLGYGLGEFQGLLVKEFYWDVEDYEWIGVEGYQVMCDVGYYCIQFCMCCKFGEFIWVDFGLVLLLDIEIFVMFVDIMVICEVFDQFVYVLLYDVLINLFNWVLLYDCIVCVLVVVW